jgi:hypothetical protein
MSSDELPVPAQQRLRRYEEDMPGAAWQHPAERREQQTIPRCELRSSHLPPQNRQLVPQDRISGSFERSRRASSTISSNRRKGRTHSQRHDREQPPEDGKTDATPIATVSGSATHDRTGPSPAPRAARRQAA